jgi:prepilin-type N-terminal cleavage/methylation domain-containing protein
MKQRGFRGFTLVEMLVVIVIILVLASIIYPTIIGVRSKASQVKCMSHMRQIGMAMQLYLGDNDDKFPMGAYETEVTDNGAISIENGESVLGRHPISRRLSEDR